MSFGVGSRPTSTRWAIRGWLLAGFVLGLIVFLGLNLASYLSARQSMETARSLRDIKEALTQIQALLTHAADAQAAMRGYVITGREQFLTPYQNGVRELPNDQRRLRQLIGGSSRHQERFTRLGVLIGEHLEFVQGAVALRRNRGMEAAVAQVSSGRGQQIMDQIRSVAGELEHEERSLLAEREAQAGAAVSEMVAILPVGTLLGLGLMLVVLFLLSSEMAERQRTDAANRTFAAIVESTDDAVISKTLGGIITSWNHGAERILGCTAGEAVGEPMLRFFPPERTPEETDILARIGRGEHIENFETVRIHKDGSRVDASVTISPVKDATGRVIGASTILRDISAAKRMERAVREREASRAAILASALDCIIAMDREGRVIEWNPAAEKTFGYPRTDVMGKLLADLIIPVRFREAHARGLARFLEDGEGPVLGKRIEMPALHRDGTEFPAELSIVVSRADELFFTAYLRDITERKRLELALRESEERFRTMADSIPQLAWMARADGFIFWYNRRWYEFTGTTPEQMEGWGWQSVHDPAVLPKVMANWTGAIASGERFEMEFPLRGADQRFRTFLTRVEPLKDSEGRVLQWFGTNTDVEALRQSEEFNRRIIESSSDCIKVLDLEARLLSMSEGGQRLLEIRDITCYLNKSWVAFWRPEDQPRVQEAVDAARAGGVGRFQAFCPSEAGNPRWWDVIVTPIRGAAGEVERLLSISRDVSAQSQAEEQIHQLNVELEERVRERTAQLETANKELEAFSYSVSHDLRAPLRGIDGYVRMLHDDYGERLDGEGHRVIGVVSSEAKRMGRLIDDLLAFSRLGRQQMQRTRVDMTEMARAVFENVTSDLPGTTPLFELQPLPPALGDPAMLRQVFANLLGNAVKFSRQQAAPVIEVGGSSRDGENSYYVRDNGAGFDEQYRDKLFGVFQRLHSESEFEGTGVGLALVQRVVHRHGGTVWAESKPGRGATFYFTLPTPKESSA